MEEKQPVEQKPQEVAWNLSIYIVQEIALLLAQASQHSAIGEFGKSINRLSEIRKRIYPNLLQDDINALDTLETEFHDSWNKAQPGGFNQRDIPEFRKAYNLQKKYSDKLMKFLKDTGYLIPAKKDKTIMVG